MTTQQAAWAALLDKVGKGLKVRTDSRKVLAGEVFVALPGANVPGTDFIPAALSMGAKYVVGPPSKELTASVSAQGAEYLEHNDTAQALGELATAHFKTDKHGLKLVGITGTNGKSTTAFIIEHLLIQHGLKTGNIGTVAYRWPGFSLDATLTTPDCWTLHELIYNMAQADVDAVVMEVSSHALDQMRVAGLRFDVAVMTNLTQDHLDYHGDMETYFEAKAKLFRELPVKDKAWVVNFDDAYGLRLAEEASMAVPFGLGVAPDCHPPLTGEILESTSSGLQLKMHYQSDEWELHSPLIGPHNALNLLAAQAVGLCLGLKVRDFKKLESFRGVPGRLERVENDHGLDVFVDYAHTPDALENVLKAMRPLTRGRLIALFGCGGDRDRTKRPLMAEAVAKHADIAILTSDNPRSEDPLQIIADVRPGLNGRFSDIEEPDRGLAIRTAVNMLEPGDVLLLAGKGHETYQLVGEKRLDFSDKDECSKAIAAKHGETPA